MRFIDPDSYAIRLLIYLSVARRINFNLEQLLANREHLPRRTGTADDTLTLTDRRELRKVERQSFVRLGHC